MMGNIYKVIRAAVVAGATATALEAASVLDTSFNPGAGADDGIVENVIQQSDGKVLVCGNFSGFNGDKKRGFIARLNPDGSIDSSFESRVSYWVRHMSLQQDNKIIIGGYFNTVQGKTVNRVARLNSDGTLDESFDVGTGATTIIAGGIDGNIDPFVFWSAVQPDGKVIITGNFREYNGIGSMGIARLLPDGRLDTSFNVGGGLNSWGRNIQIQPNGQILVAGWFTSYNNKGFNRLVRINPDGSADTSFNPFFGDKTAIYTTATLPDGKIIAAGHSLNDEGLFLREMERLNSDGTVDESWVGRANEKVESVYLQPDGKLILAGNFSQVNGTSRARIARLNSNGTLDTDFSAEVDNFIWCISPGPTGKVYVSGGFSTIDGVARKGVARLNTGGGVALPNSPKLVNLSFNGDKFSASAQTQQGYSYTLQYKTPVSSGSWTSLNPVQGNGGMIELVDNSVASSHKIYRVEVK